MLAETDVSLRVANGKVIRPKRFCTLKLYLNRLLESLEYIVRKDFIHDVIHGWNILKTFRAITDLADNKIFLEKCLVEDLPKISQPFYSELETCSWVAFIDLSRNWIAKYQGTEALMNGAYENETFSRTQVYFWYKRFKDGRKSIADDSRSGRPLTSTTDRNNGHGYCKKEFGEHLNMKKLCGYFGPRNLTDRQRETRLSICKDSIKTENNDSEFLKTIITGDETWYFLFDPQTKKQSLEWHTQILLGRRKFVLTSPKEK
ncbi:hypothetical protein LAZ67_5002503 [Cordylochernes scorpioides]|uniref:Transposase n=1 Tax=Cordylochernes scorpioides TaxID=51811 RepID=A0ABY6KL85_9ARAC|nr:hypothetical protein LAZ67_5002503 [Cordylochernes scorpioides]